MSRMGASLVRPFLSLVISMKSSEKLGRDFVVQDANARNFDFNIVAFFQVFGWIETGARAVWCASGDQVAGPEPITRKSTRVNWRSAVSCWPPA